MLFDNTYINLPHEFYKVVRPTPCVSPKLIAWNKDLAKKIGLSDIGQDTSKVLEYFSGNKPLPGSEPISLAYSGHQFGNFVPELGDGRAVLLGELLDKNGDRYDLQLKGSGQTPFSRDGDGRSALGPVIREYIVSEAMHHLGIPTTRALAALETGESVMRNNAEQGAILTRIASSHIRFGTFEYFAVRDDKENLKKLVNYTIKRHFPEIAESENPLLDLFKEVSFLHAELITKWMSVGFVHGVMNTDNCLICGETIDYGPCAFLDEFDFFKTFSSIDFSRRYAFGRQAQITQWNLSRLAASFLTIGGTKSAFEQELENFQFIYEKEFLKVIAAKLGFSEVKEGDEEIISKWFEHLQVESLDYTLSFRNLADLIHKKTDSIFGDFETVWRNRINEQRESSETLRDRMNKVNPLFIPRNHQIERAIRFAQKGDFSIFKDLNHTLQKPFENQPEMIAYSEAPILSERVEKTFCGT